jgi:hypothetical protein
MIEDETPGAGRITISCFQESWTAAWGAMGHKNKVSDFFILCDPHYLIDNIAGNLKKMVFQGSALTRRQKKSIIDRRRCSGDFNCMDLDSLTKEEASDLWEEIEGAEIWNIRRVNDMPPELMEKLYGEEWWFNANAEKPNPKYEYLKRIIETVQAALKLQSAAPAPAKEQWGMAA